jgi:hypothetical protein
MCNGLVERFNGVLKTMLKSNGPIISIATFLNGSDTTGTEISGTLLFFGLLTDF